ncbi:hypothetical protein D3C87_1027750 [compost metagenome]
MPDSRHPRPGGAFPGHPEPAGRAQDRMIGEDLPGHLLDPQAVLAEDDPVIRMQVALQERQDLLEVVGLDRHEDVARRRQFEIGRPSAHPGHEVAGHEAAKFEPRFAELLHPLRPGDHQDVREGAEAGSEERPDGSGADNDDRGPDRAFRLRHA